MRQAAYDGVMKAGGSGKSAWEILVNLRIGGCNKFDMTKTSCNFSKYPNNKKTCWADTAYQTCGGGKKGQKAYDKLMKLGGSSSVSAVLHKSLEATKCELFEEEKIAPPTAPK